MTKTKKLCVEDFLPRAFSHYTCADLPDNWRDLDEDELIKLCEESPWEPFENYDGAYVLENIHSLAYSFCMVAEGSYDEKQTQ